MRLHTYERLAEKYLFQQRILSCRPTTRPTPPHALVGTARHFARFDNRGFYPDSDPAHPVARRIADLVALWSSRKELAERYPNSVGIPLRR
jgi:hypothetical protein